MDKAIEELFKTFNHIAREIQIYLISGLLIIFDIYVIDFFYYDCSLYSITNQNWFILPIVVLSYVLGHISMSFFGLILELPKLDKKINKILGFEYDVDSNLLPSIYSQDKSAYSHFIERYVLLTMMRWNMSAALFINFLVDLTYTLFHSFNWQILLLTILSLLSSIMMYILQVRTEKDYSDRIQSMKDAHLTKNSV
ncbi:hypothetical protein [Spirosoma aerophilum]